MSDPIEFASPGGRQSRRTYLRRQVRSLAYIDLGADNGGIVLNMSEGGLAVHSAATLENEHLPAIRFQLPQSPGWIEARGEIAWTSETKRQAGIQFVELSPFARRQIRQWIASSEHVGAAQEARRWTPLPRTSGLSVAPQERKPVFSSGAVEVNIARDTSDPAPQSRALISSLQTVKPSLAAASASARADRLGGGLRLRFDEAEPAVPQGDSASHGWAAFLSFLGMLAVVSFIVGLAAGRGDFARLGHFFSRSVARADASSPIVATASASLAGISPAAAAEPLARITVTSRSYVPVMTPGPFAASRVDRLQVGRVDRRVNPKYPPDALAQHLEGTVQLRVTIAATGVVEDVTVLSGPPLLVSSATSAIRQWRYQPTLLDGRPIEIEEDVACVFWLPPSEPTPRK
ncbi:MAG TPA: TonB family protein [Candidatus Acidoferrum sp.]|nr:TonB family protein [Candidatus Acidoferrum sp.]